MFKFLYTPFPRPQISFKNVLWIFLLGFIASVFVILFKPFGIINDSGLWFFNLLIVSMGVVFSASIVLMEFLIPLLIKKTFKSWNLGKAILWYAWLILFVGGTMFLYKSFLGGFSDFTFKEYINVLGRISGIGLIVSFFAIGLFNYFNKKNISLLASKETYALTAPNVKSVSINLDELLYIGSDDNYVDIHIESNGKRDKIIFRSSLKNIEEQIVNPLTPIYRCHRRYLININCFKIKNDKSRNASITLKKYDDEIPVSAKYVSSILELVRIRP